MSSEKCWTQDAFKIEPKGSPSDWMWCGVKGTSAMTVRFLAEGGVAVDLGEGQEEWARGELRTCCAERGSQRRCR